MSGRKYPLTWFWISVFILISSQLTLFAIAGSFPLLHSESKMKGQSESLLIDDFSRSNGISSFGTQWQMFTDRVMGGLSTGEWDYDTIDGRRCVRLRGDVSLENNGGFVQIALPLTKEEQPFDASSYKGARIWAYGNGEAYHVHLRTTDSRRPWQYYGAKFVADNSWRMYDLRFSDFEPENLQAELDPGQLVRIAVVAIKKEFEADISVARIEFYR